jgi:hypothetical protein
MIHRIFAATFSILVSFHGINAEFQSCKFNFGTDWDYVNTNKTSAVSNAVDYVTIWLNDPTFNQYWHGDMLNFCKNNNKTPVFYAYIIAKASGLGDGDAGGKLTTEGAAFIKNNWSKVTSRYQDYATQTANMYGTTKPIIWLMEPDYYQYFSGNQTVKLTLDDAVKYMNELIAIVKGKLPNALISLDISPWNTDESGYIKKFDMSKFTFMSTSGGRTEAGNSRIRMDNGNNVTWSSVSSASGKGIIADDGYGSGGGSTAHDATWDDVNNLKARIADGVVAITQKSPASNWGTTIASLRTALSGQNVKCSGISAIFPDNMNRNLIQKSSVSIIGTKSGFSAKLPFIHDYSSFSLVDISGRTIYSGKIAQSQTELRFANLANDIWFLHLDGIKSSETIRFAMMK